MANCVICDEPLMNFPTCQLREQGLETLIKASIIREDGKSALMKTISVVHKHCRNWYTKRPRPENPNEEQVIQRFSQIISYFEGNTNNLQVIGNRDNITSFCN